MIRFDRQMLLLVLLSTTGGALGGLVEKRTSALYGAAPPHRLTVSEEYQNTTLPWSATATVTADPNVPRVVGGEPSTYQALAPSPSAGQEIQPGGSVPRQGGIFESLSAFGAPARPVSENALSVLESAAGTTLAQPVTAEATATATATDAFESIESILSVVLPGTNTASGFPLPSQSERPGQFTQSTDFPSNLPTGTLLPGPPTISHPGPPSRSWSGPTTLSTATASTTTSTSSTTSSSPTGAEVPAASTGPTKSQQRTGTVAGAATGAVAGAIIVVMGALYVIRRRLQKRPIFGKAKPDRVYPEVAWLYDPARTPSQLSGAGTSTAGNMRNFSSETSQPLNPTGLLSADDLAAERRASDAPEVVPAVISGPDRENSWAGGHGGGGGGSSSGGSWPTRSEGSPLLGPSPAPPVLSPSRDTSPTGSSSASPLLPAQNHPRWSPRSRSSLNLVRPLSAVHEEHLSVIPLHEQDR